ncbi:phytanoyl-CoA dioxygenase [Planctomycetota bacterium]|nr:phytanoyl-CoA dioxygenase [Planctomycetota bacterium]
MTTIDSAAIAERFHRDGWAVVRGVFPPAEVAAIRAAIDRLRDWALAIGGNYRHGNLVTWIDQIGKELLLRGMQWPAHREPVLESVRTDPRMLAIVSGIAGHDLRQIINQIHWKPPGSPSSVQWHVDRKNRTPAEAFRALESSYVQTAIAVDPMVADNGPLLVVQGSHRRSGCLDDRGYNNFARDGLDRAPIHALGFTDADIIAIECDPGDVLLWHVDTIHGSDLNRHDRLDRTIYINGYVAARSTMRGNWAFLAGRPMPLPEIDIPVLISREDIFAPASLLPSHPGRARFAD